MNVISGIARSPKLVALVALFGLLLFVATSEIWASSTTIGNPLVLRTDKNTLAGGVYVSVQPFGAGAVGGSLTTWSIFAHTGTAGRKVTPLLLESTGGSQYVLRAIGQTRSAAPGLNSSLAFNVQAGNGTINNASYVFGWKDGTQTMHNRGVISNEIDFTGTLFDTRVVTTSAATVITGSDVGTALTFSVSLGRVYSFEATAEITNLPPVANAGPDRVLEWTGGQVSHQGTGDDPDGDTVTYDWSFVTAPAGSTATLTGDETPIPSFTPDLLGDYELDLTVDDGRGGTDVDTVKLTVEDTIPPLITKSIDGVQFESGLLTYLTSDTEITVSVTDAHSVVSCIITLTGTTGVVNPLCAEGDNVFSITGPDGAYILDANAIDESGNIGVDPITLVLDNAPPTITSAQDPSTNGAGWNKTSVTVSFTCSDTGSGIASCTSPQTVTTEGAGQVVSGTAVDNLGDIATADHTVNIDTTDPVVTPPADQIEEATSASGATASFSPPATDNLSGVDTLISAPPSGSLFPLGGTLVTHAATDVAGNSASATHTVTVVDTTSPTLTAPSPLILECNAENGLESSDPAIQAWLNSASASDLVDADPTITNDLVPGLCDVGVTKTVTFTATDDFNNSNMATSTITVVDNTAPTVTAAFEPNDKIKKDSGLYTAVFACSDNCDPSPSLKGVIRTPSLDGLEVKLKVKSRVEVKFNLKKGKVTISGPDPQAILDQINENGGLLTDSGQLIKAKVKDKYGSKPSFKFKKDGTLRWTQDFGQVAKIGSCS